MRHQQLRVRWVLMCTVVGLGAGCSPEVEVTSVRPVPAFAGADATLPVEVTLPRGQRLKAKGASLFKDGWYQARHEGRTLYFEKAGWVPYPVSAERAFIQSPEAPVRALPAADAEVEQRLPINTEVQCSRAADLAAPGYVARVSEGVVSGYLEAAQVGPSRVNAGSLLTLAQTALKERRGPDALALARLAAAEAPPDPRAASLYVALLEKSDPAGAEAFRKARTLVSSSPVTLPPLTPVTEPGPAFVVATAATLRSGDNEEAESRGMLPIGTQVNVRGIRGRYAWVDVIGLPKTRSLVIPATPVAEPPFVEGYVAVTLLDVERPLVQGLREQARAEAAAQMHEVAAARMLRAHALAPEVPEIYDELVELALAAHQYPVAVHAALNRPEKEGAPLFEVQLDHFFGCRGDVLRAQALEPNPQGPLYGAFRTPRVKLPAFAGADFLRGDKPLSALPGNACLRAVDRFAVQCPSCEQEEIQDHERTPEEMRAEEQAELRRMELEAWQGGFDEGLRSTFPLGPWVRVTLTNHTLAYLKPPRPLVLAAFAVETGAHCPLQLNRSVLRAVALPDLRIPPGRSIEVWFEVPNYQSAELAVLEGAEGVEPEALAESHAGLAEEGTPRPTALATRSTYVSSCCCPFREEY